MGSTLKISLLWSVLLPVKSESARKTMLVALAFAAMDKLPANNRQDENGLSLKLGVERDCVASFEMVASQGVVGVNLELY